MSVVFWGNDLRKQQGWESEAGKGRTPMPDTSLSRSWLWNPGAHSYGGSLGDGREPDSALSHRRARELDLQPPTPTCHWSQWLLGPPSSSGHSMRLPLLRLGVFPSWGRSNGPQREQGWGVQSISHRQGYRGFPGMLLPLGETMCVPVDGIGSCPNPRPTCSLLIISGAAGRETLV